MTRILTALTGNAALLLTLTMLIWGGNAVAGKFAVGHVSPLLLTWLRWTGAALILAAVARRHLLADWPSIRARLPYLFFMGATGYAIFNALLYSSLLFTTAINVTIIQAGMPMFVFALNFLAFRARVSLVQIGGYALTLTGVTVAAGRGSLAQLAALEINTGDAIMLAAAAGYAVYSVALASKPGLHWLSFLTALVISAAITATLFMAWEAATPAFIWPTTATGWTVVAYTAILPSIVAQGFYIRGTELIGANKAALFVNLVPIFGALFAVLLLGEDFRWFHGGSLALVIAGIAIAQRFGR